VTAADDAQEADRAGGMIVDMSTNFRPHDPADQAPSTKDVEPRLSLGLDTFGDLAVGDDGQPISYAEAIRLVVEEAVMADGAGVDAFAVGEHHRPEYSISSPEMVLGGIASRTERIRLGSGVTVLSSDDPVRVFQRFATLDAIARGRAEVILGRGSFTESFPLFGYDLRDYDVLFEEKLDLFVKLLDERPVTWSGTTRAPLEDADVFPKTEAGLRTWVGVGGTPQSVIRTARHGLRLMLAVIGGRPQRFRPYLELYRKACEEFGTTAWPVGLHSPGFVAETDEEAREMYWPGYQSMRNRIGVERGWPPASRQEFEHEIAGGSLYVGSPDTVARKIATTVADLGVARFDLIYTMGPQARSARLRAVELFGTRVAPIVRELVGHRTEVTA
jgi:probable LLM family oxidoreductase